MGDLLRSNIDLNTQLNTERKYRELLKGQCLVNESQAHFTVPVLALPFSENIILQTASRLLFLTFDWIKDSNHAFKLLR